MSTIVPLVRFEHKVTWKIKNFDFRPHVSITSRKFDAKCFDVMKWGFCLHPRGETQTDYMQFSVSLKHAGSHNVTELHIVSVQFVVYLIGEKNEKYFLTEGSFVPTVSVPTSSAINFIPLVDFVDEKHLQNGSLVLICELTTTGDQKEYTSSVYSEQLMSLASDVFVMLDTQSYSDMLAVSEDKTICKVHECILRARCPQLFELIDMAEKKNSSEFKSFWYSHMSTPALRILLEYFYGKVFVVVPGELVSELRSVAVKNKLNELENQLQEFPVHKTMESEIIVEDINLKCPLRKIRWHDGDRKHMLHRFRCELKRNPRASDLMVTMDITARGHDESYINTSFKFRNPVEGVAILLKCTLSLVDKDDRVLLKTQEQCHTFSNDEWSPTMTPPFLTKSVYLATKPHALKCDVRISEMRYEDIDVSCGSLTAEPGPPVPLFNNLSLLGSDILLMYENRVKCDLRIEVAGKWFFGQRSFLERRSEMIMEKLDFLENNPTGGRPGMATIHLDSVAPDICEMVLRYMYSGQIDTDDKGVGIALVDAASYFRLRLLYEKYLYLLRD